MHDYAWTTFFLVLFAFATAHRQIRKKVLAKRMREQQLVVSAYVETGIGYQEIHSFGRSVAASAKRERSKLLVKRCKEAKSGDFKAVVECPSCTRVDVHYLNNKNHRQCNSCGFKWRYK